MKKVTKKEAIEFYAKESEVKDAMHDLERTFRAGESIPQEYFELKKELKALEEQEATFPKVLVSYCIGHRDYHDEVIKVGKSYFLHGRTMTAGRGYWNIKEIPEVTEQMRKQYMDDLYYY